MKKVLKKGACVVGGVKEAKEVGKSGCRALATAIEGNQTKSVVVLCY